MTEKQNKTELCIDMRISDLGDNKYYLSAGYDEKKGVYYLPSLEFQNIQDPEYPNYKELWDNSHYLLNALYPALQKYLETKEECPVLHGIMGTIPIKDFQVVFDILNTGVELGFFKNIDYEEREEKD